MTHFEVQDTLEGLTVLIDTREHVDTPGFQRRAAHFPRWRREKLDAGDYSAELTISEQKCRIPVAIERKMSIDELCQCFGRERARFMREFERAKESGTRLYLIVERATWEDLFAGRYRSRLNSKALIASILAWSVRYDVRFFFCRPETCGELIYKILYYEAKEVLEHDGAGGAAG